MKRIKNKGFSLIELMLVLAIMMSMMVLKVQNIQQQNTLYNAKTLAQEIKTVSNATNAYIVMNYSSLSKLSASGSTCTSNSVCDINISTLQSANLLPPNFSSQTILKNPYIIQLKRSGANPNYMISGVVLTDSQSKGQTFSPEIAGETVRDIGSDGGLNTADGSISGLMGKWSATSEDFPTLSGKTNYIGSVVGSLSGAYYVYLRRDGTLPMTGDLDMGQHSINNANDISASADITAGGIISATGNLVTHKQVVAQDGYGDTMTIGGNGSGGDYKITMNANRPLRIYNPNAGSYTTVLNVDHNVKIDQRLGLMGTDPNNIPSGWGGGLTTLDVYANGTVGAGSGGNLNAYMNSVGTIYGSGTITGGSLVSNGDINASGNINTSQNVYASNTNASNIASGGYLIPNNTSIVESACQENGLISKTNDGEILSCQNGVWKKNAGSYDIKTYNSNGNEQTNIGTHNFCALSKVDPLRNDGYNDPFKCSVEKTSSGWILEQNEGYVDSTCQAICF